MCCNKQKLPRARCPLDMVTRVPSGARAVSKQHACRAVFENKIIACCFFRVNMARKRARAACCFLKIWLMRAIIFENQSFINRNTFQLFRLSLIYNLSRRNVPIIDYLYVVMKHHAKFFAEIACYFRIFKNTRAVSKY